MISPLLSSLVAILRSKSLDRLAFSDKSQQVPWIRHEARLFALNRQFQAYHGLEVSQFQTGSFFFIFELSIRFDLNQSLFLTSISWGFGVLGFWGFGFRV